MSKSLHIGIVLVVVALFGFGAWLHLRPADAPETSPVTGMVVSAEVGGPFELTAHTGEVFTDKDLAGDFALIYFGYTFCPDVCPTELGNMAAAIDELEAESGRVRPVMITIDPQRDTREVLAEYVPLFHERLIGLTGSEEQIRSVARAYRVFYRKVEDPNYSEYLMDHTSFIYLLDPEGEVAAMFRYGTAPVEIANTVRELVREQS